MCSFAHCLEFVGANAESNDCEFCGSVWTDDYSSLFQALRKQSLRRQTHDAQLPVPVSFKHATSQRQSSLLLLVPEFELYGFSDSTEIGRRDRVRSPSLFSSSRRGLTTPIPKAWALVADPMSRQ